MIHKIIVHYFLCIICLISLNVFAQSNLNRDEENKKIEQLLTKMTMEEKIGQLAQFHFNLRFRSHNDWEDMIRKGQISSFLNAGSLDDKIKLQRVAVEESPMGIPLIFGRDVIHGFRTVFPIPLGQAASWNPDLVKKAAGIAASEAAEIGIHWTFAPMLDLARDARWGRVAESVGEDPYLASRMAEAMVRGFQGDNLADRNTIAACAKHYVGYGAAEGGRDYNTTLIPENELRNFYLPAFKSAVDAGVATVMSAFNDLNGIPTSGNPFTLRQILKGEWGFDGFVVSDWMSITEMVNHGFCADEREAAMKAIKAGVDMEMVSTSYKDYLKELIESGLVDKVLLNEAVTNILRIKIHLGLFENPYPPTVNNSVLLSEEHLAVARDLAAQSLVLLKNENAVLPIKENVKSIAIIGPLADLPRDQLGTWVPDGRGSDAVTPLQAFKEIGPTYKILHAKGLDHPRSVDKAGFSKVIETADETDMVILFVGEDERISGESHSRAFLNLPGAQEDLINAIAETGKPIVLVIMAGRPLTFGSIIDKVDAIIYAWHPGTMGGPAIYDVLTGKSVPSGKLPVSFPRTVGQIPIYYNHRNTGRPPLKDMLGIPMGTVEDPKAFVSNYLDVDFTPQYPFGYGLSYTTFKYNDLHLSSDNMKPSDTLRVIVNIQNTGKFKADEIVQLYIRDIAASVTRPVNELKAFKCITLNPNEKQDVIFKLTDQDLAFWNIDMKYVAEPGMFEVMVGSSSADEDLIRASFELLK